MSERKTCIDCGYASEEALKEVGKLTAEQVKLLAAMAITHHDSHFGDNKTDLVRGCKLVLKREYYWDTL